MHKSSHGIIDLVPQHDLIEIDPLPSLMFIIIACLFALDQKKATQPSIED